MDNAPGVRPASARHDRDKDQMEPDQQSGPEFEVTPLLPSDPVRIGDFWLDARLTASFAGTAFRAHADGSGHLVRGQKIDAGTPAVLVQLSDGAANDKAARDRFSGFVNKLHIDDVLARGGYEQDEGRLGRKFLSEADDPVDPDTQPLAPWVAMPFDGTPRVPHLAAELLDTVSLTKLPPKGAPSGPDYELPWVQRRWPGLNRVWPLPWPGRYDRAGWVTILVSWLLMVLMTALAIAIAIWIFRNQPPQNPPPQTPSNSSSQQQPPPSASPSPQTASPTPESASPTPTPGESSSPTPSDSASPSPSAGQSESPSPSPSPSSGESPTPDPSGSPGGRPTPPSRL